MEFKGTKGKWSIGVVPEYNDTLKSAMIEIQTNSVWVCKIQNNGIIQLEEGNYNALLISKAPEMLEMLKIMLVEFKATDVRTGAIKEDLQQLIKQATEL